MKICIINTFYYPNMIGGAEVCVVKLAEKLSKSGKEVHVICTGYKDEVEVINDVIVHRIKIKNFYSPIEWKNNNNLNPLALSLYKLMDIYNLFNYNLLKNKIEDIKPDVVHVNNLYGFSVIIWSVLKKMKIPWIQTVHDYGLLKSNEGIVNKLKEKLYRKLSEKVDLVTAPSEFTLNKFKERKFFINAKLQVVNNGIDINYDYLKNEVSRKKRVIISKEKIKFVFLGRLEKVKGIVNLIEAFKNIKCNNIELIIAGKGTLQNDVKLLAESDSRIHYVGFLNEIEINKLLKESDVLIIPSLWEEPFGMVILEAYKFGIPVIGSNKGGIPEVIDNYKTGRLFNPENKNELVDLIYYFNEKENILNMMENCIMQVEKFNFDIKCREYINLYDYIVCK